MSSVGVFFQWRVNLGKADALDQNLKPGISAQVVKDWIYLQVKEQSETSVAGLV